MTLVPSPSTPKATGSAGSEAVGAENPVQHATCTYSCGRRPRVGDGAQVGPPRRGRRPSADGHHAPPPPLGCVRIPALRSAGGCVPVRHAGGIRSGIGPGRPATACSAPGSATDLGRRADQAAHLRGRKGCDHLGRVGGLVGGSGAPACRRGRQRRTGSTSRRAQTTTSSPTITTWAGHVAGWAPRCTSRSRPGSDRCR
jgi:hypothetical protein